MAGTSDVRAAGFDASSVREALRFAMSMGLPDEEAQRVTFRWTTTNTYDLADNTGTPYDLTAVPTDVQTKDDVLIPAAVEFMSARSFSSDSGTVFGEFQTPSAVITVLDEDYVSVVGADQVLLGGNTYKVIYVEPPLGLFDLTVYMIHVRAVDES